MTFSYKKILGVSTLVLTLGLTGYNQANQNNASAQPASTINSNAASQAQATEKLNEAAKTGAAITADGFVSTLPDTAPTYKVITTGTMAPFSFSDAKGNLMGFDIDAMRAIGEAGGFKVAFYKTEFKNMFPTIASGKYDIAASGISYTEERKGLYNLSDSYFFNPSAIMYKNTSQPVKTLAELKNMKVAGMDGSKQVEQVKAATGATNVDIYPTTYLLFQALVQDKEQAIVQDEPFLRYTAKNFPDQKVTIVAYEGQNEPSAQQVVVLRKGNDALTAKVNQGIATIKANGKLQQLEDKWFGK